MPPLQTEVGETVGDVIARFARLTGLTSSTGLLSTSAPTASCRSSTPTTTRTRSRFMSEDHNDERNFRVKHSSLILGETTSYRV